MSTMEEDFEALRDAFRALWAECMRNAWNLALFYAAVWVGAVLALAATGRL